MTETPISSKPPLDDKRKTAMLRYIGIMFVVAFLFVLVSLLGELHSSEAAISELNQASTSAVQKAEQLQDTNRQLETDNAYLNGRMEELEKQLADLELDLAVAQEQTEKMQDSLSRTEQDLTELEQETARTKRAYELLLRLEQSGPSPELLAELEQNKQYLGETALHIYENMTKKGE